MHYPPVRIPASPAPRHPRYLSWEERTTIADLHRERKTLREIAQAVGRHPSTISRELSRNSDPAGRYLPGTAERLMAERVQRPRRRRVAVDEQLRAVVRTLLGKRWSPEQVAHDLRERFPGQRERQLCTESIYQAIYDPNVDVTRPAKRRRRRRRRRVQGLERRGRLTAMTMISQRPAQVADRGEVGHWEGDCIMGPGNRSAIGTLVERRTRFLILVHVPTGRPTAQAISDGVCAALQGLPAGLRRTLTWDQGKEMALHQQITQRLGTPVFFCDAHSPWQRPHQREHERAAARLLSQGDRPERRLPRRAVLRRRRGQRSTPKDPRVGPAHRPAHWAARRDGLIGHLPADRSAPEDRRRVTVDLGEQVLHVGSRRHPLVLVEASMSVTPVQRPQTRPRGVTQPSHRKPGPLLTHPAIPGRPALHNRHQPSRHVGLDPHLISYTIRHRGPTPPLNPSNIQLR